MSSVRVEREGAILIITLDRPEALNAVNAELAGALGEALEQLSRDHTLSVGLITGAGRAFCAGADLKALAAGESTAAPEHPEWGFAGLVRHWVPKPLIAAVNGHALGGGTEIVLACDLCVMEPSAELGLPEVRRGLFAAAGGVIRLQRELPPKVAAEVALAGRTMKADEALRWGLVNAVSEPGASLEAGLELASRVAAGAPLALVASKRLLREAAGAEDAAWAANAEERQRVFSSADAAEGARAFAEKRLPRWSGT